MTDPNVEPEDIETPAPVEPVEPEEDDEDLDPGEPGTPPANETPEQMQARIAQLEERNGKLWARIQRNKGKPVIPAAPAPAAPAPAAPAAAPSLSRDEAILFSKGLSEDEVEHAKKVSAVQGIKLTEAIVDPLYTAWKEQKNKDARAQAAQLPASKGARATVKKSFNTPGLSDEDHKALFNERMGR